VPLPVPAPPVAAAAPPPPRELPEEPAILATLAAYASAYSKLDAAGVKRLYPGVNEQDLRRAFSDLRSQQMLIQGERITVTGTTATVSCVEANSVIPIAGAPRRVSRQTVFQLEKRNGAWTIVGRR
jgi:hypothetical protein